MQTKTNYNEAIKTITSRKKFHICLGLERIAKVLKLIGNPQKNLNIIHIAGTNGKGSVSKILSDVLKESGYKTGLYTSPHIIDYTERIQVNGACISKEDFSQTVKYINKIAETNDIYLTEFEILTAVMFKYFFEQKTDICIIETGLGGRLDATNVIDKNILSIITSISLDHTDRLGNTIDLIATEKAGIIKNNCPVIVDKNNKGYKIINKKSFDKNAKLIFSEDIQLEFKNNINYAIVNNQKYVFNLLGLWQKENLGLAIAGIKYLQAQGYKITDEALSITLKNVSWPCRFQYIKEYNLIIDGSHNPDGAKLLRKSLDYYFPSSKRIWIYGSMKNKNYSEIMNTIFRTGDTIHLCEFSHKGSETVDNLKKKLKHNYKKIQLTEIDKIITTPQNGVITIISGSFYMIGEMLILNKKLKNIARLDNT